MATEQKTDTKALNLKEKMTKTKGHTFMPVVITSSIARNKLSQMRQNIDNVKMLNKSRYYPELLQPINPTK